MIYTLPQTVVRAANRYPKREAFKCGNHSVNYSELSDQMRQMAFSLHQLDVKKGDRVGICLNRCLETAIAIYGVMYAGAVYVPIDPKAPASRIRFLIEDCGIEILISNPTQKRNLVKVLEEPTPVKNIIGVTGNWTIPSMTWEEVLANPTDFVCPFPILEQDLAYIIYTSGSTGVPKGIMHTHYSGLAYAKLSAENYSLNENDRLGNHAPIYFDISTLAYFAAPLVGACAVIVSDAHTIMPASQSNLIEAEQITVWYSVPLALMQMLEKGMLEDRDMSALRWVLYAGEAFPPKHLRSLMLQWPQARFSNMYGPTETNVCTYYNLPAPPEGDEPIPIGQVWANTDFLIIDEEGCEVAQGEKGELLIRSATLMSGYWQQPELTERSWYRLKRNTGSEEKFYKTGDLVVLDTEGCLRFYGRKDHQVKLRGYRLELGEIETQLLSHSLVSEAVVFILKGKEETNSLGAVVSVKTSQEATEAELIAYLKDKLPFYAVPGFIQITNDFPRTANGKVNRKKLIEWIK